MRKKNIRLRNRVIRLILLSSISLLAPFRIHDWLGVGRDVEWGSMVVFIDLKLISWLFRTTYIPRTSHKNELRWSYRRKTDTKLIPKHDYAFISNFVDTECLTPFLGMFVVSGVFSGSRRLTPIPPTYQKSEILASYRQLYKWEIKQNRRS